MYIQLYYKDILTSFTIIWACVYTWRFTPVNRRKWVIGNNPRASYKWTKLLLPLLTTGLFPPLDDDLGCNSQVFFAAIEGWFLCNPFMVIVFTTVIYIIITDGCLPIY